MSDRTSSCKTKPSHLSIGIPVWINDVKQLPELERCLDSVMDFPVFIVNGKWYDIEGDYPRSIPEAIELMESYTNVEIIDSPNQLFNVINPYWNTYG